MNEVKGIAFPFRIGGRGSVVMSGQTITKQQHIEDGIKGFLGTREKERVMRPYDGLEDLDIFFADLNETTKNMAIFKIREKLQEFEPRIMVMDVQIHEAETLDGLAHIITLSYEEVDSGRVNSVSINV